jgi:hypothetical protein
VRKTKLKARLRVDHCVEVIAMLCGMRTVQLIEQIDGQQMQRHTYMFTYSVC